MCLRCELVYRDTGEIVGEGRGAARLDEFRGWTENNCLKIAEKRAQIDAVLRTVGLSEVLASQAACIGANCRAVCEHRAGPAYRNAGSGRIGTATTIHASCDCILQRSVVWMIDLAQPRHSAHMRGSTFARTCSVTARNRSTDIAVIIAQHVL